MHKWCQLTGCASSIKANGAQNAGYAFRGDVVSLRSASIAWRSAAVPSMTSIIVLHANSIT